MRTTRDRIRHTLLFEGIGIVLTSLIVATLVDESVVSAGVLALILSLLAMGWNYQYNLLFDRWLLKTRGSAKPGVRTIKLRVLHAVGFEGGFLVVSLPLVAWWLELGIWQALVMDIGFSIFFVFYGFVFNWGYDLAFPLDEAPAVANPDSV